MPVPARVLIPAVIAGARVPDLLDAETWSALTAVMGLTRRESEVLKAALYDEGRTSLARRLGISEHTVHAHFGHILQKMGVSSIAQAISFAFSAYVELNSRRRSGIPSIGVESRGLTRAVARASVEA